MIAVACVGIDRGFFVRFTVHEYASRPKRTRRTSRFAPRTSRDRGRRRGRHRRFGPLSWKKISLLNTVSISLFPVKRPAPPIRGHNARRAGRGLEVSAYRPRVWMARLSRRTRRVLGLAAGAAAVGWAVREYALYRSDGLGEARAGTSRRGRRRRESQSSDVNARVGDEQNRPRLLRLERETDDADDAGDDLDLGSSIRGHRHGGGDSHVSTSSCAGSRRDSFDHGSDDLGCDDGTNTSTMSGPSLNDQSQHGNTSGTDSATPNFFASTKFFACLELEESQELFAASEEFDVPPNTVVFRQGDDSSSGIYIVVQGTLGVYLQENQTDDEDEDELIIEDEDAGSEETRKKKKKHKKGTSVRKGQGPARTPVFDQHTARRRVRGRHRRPGQRAEGSELHHARRRSSISSRDTGDADGVHPRASPHVGDVRDASCGAAVEGGALRVGGFSGPATGAAGWGRGVPVGGARDSSALEDAAALTERLERRP